MITMKKTITKLFFFIICCISLSCNLNATYENEPAEKTKGEIVAGKLYDNLRLGDYSQIESMFSEKFFKVTSKDTLRKFLLKSRNNIGITKQKNCLNGKPLGLSGIILR
jgi:hypothetical protein